MSCGNDIKDLDKLQPADIAKLDANTLIPVSIKVGTTTYATISVTKAQLLGGISINGVAPDETGNVTLPTNEANSLVKTDANNKLPEIVLPATTLIYKGTFNPNSQQLSNTTGNLGDVYKVIADGAANFDPDNNDHGTWPLFYEGDMLYYYGSANNSGTWHLLYRPPRGSKVIKVANQAARFALTTAQAKEGDTVIQTGDGKMFFVTDKSNLSNANGYTAYTAAAASSVEWESVQNKPSLELTENKGQANGYAPLNASTKIDSQYLPDGLGDIIEYADLAAFPGTGAAGILYVALDSNLIYRWSGSAYVQVAAGNGWETTSTLGALINGATEKTTPADADMFALMDSAASNIVKKLSWSSIKTALQGFYGTQDEIIVAVSDETIDITTGTAKMTFYCPRAYKLIKLKASLNAISTGTCTFTIKQGATTLATLNCSAAGLTSSSALNVDLALNDALTIDVSGTFTGAKGGKVYFVWYATGAA